MRSLVRSAAVLTAGLLMIPALAAPSSAAKPTSLSGSWLARQLGTGVVQGPYGPDAGLTADTALALKALGHHRQALKKARRGLGENLGGWIGTGGEVYAGSVAKAAVTAKTLGANPRSFGGVNLLKRLGAQVTAAGPAKGRIHDTSAYGDYANTIGQAYAARALSSAHSPKARSVVRFLLAQQCGKGYFRLTFASTSAASQKCAAGSAPDTDTTALAVLSLSSIAHPNAKVRASITKATRWLKRQQHRNGSFGGGPTTAAPNANSTGVAGWALGEVGACKQARRAASWVKRLQVGAKAGGALAHDRGAIAYDRAALSTARTVGITGASQDEWRRATAQAAPALRFLHGC